MATDFADRPTASIPGACSGWVETQAAYRFFDQGSEKKQGLGWEDILTPHLECTLACMREQRVVLCLQDTLDQGVDSIRFDWRIMLPFSSYQIFFTS